MYQKTVDTNNSTDEGIILSRDGKFETLGNYSMEWDGDIPTSEWFRLISLHFQERYLGQLAMDLRNQK